MAIILSEQEKIELADAQKSSYLFKNAMGEFSGQKEKCPVCHKKKFKYSGPVSKMFFYSIGRIVVCHHVLSITWGCGNSQSNISFHFSNKLEHQLEEKRDQQAKW